MSITSLQNGQIGAEMGSEAARSNKKTRVLLVDDHPAVREGLIRKIDEQTDLEICGEAADVGSALKLVESENPDVIVVDIALKGSSGFDLLRRLDSKEATLRSLVCSMYDERTYAERSLRSGAFGYVMKDEATDKIIQAIRQVRDGKIYLSKLMTDRLLKLTVTGTDPATTKSRFDTLSDREIEVFRLLGQGKSTREIATSMHISPKTVETYQSRIKQKLHIESGRELIMDAVQSQIPEPTMAAS